MRWFKHGDPLTLKKGGRPHNRADGSCVIEGCDKPGPFVKGMCPMHYMRQYKYGSPDIVHSHGGGRPLAATRCRIEGCDNPRPYTQGLCRSHYRLLQKYGDPNWQPPPEKVCSVDGCERKYFARGWCLMHYHRWKEHGDTGEAAPRRADAGRGHTQADGYRKVTVNGKKIKEHRHAMELKLGRELLPDETVHHVNGKRDDNRPENLELWTGMHGNGQRVEDLVEFVLNHYSDLVQASQNRRTAR